SGDSPRFGWNDRGKRQIPRVKFGAVSWSAGEYRVKAPPPGTRLRRPASESESGAKKTAFLGPQSIRKCGRYLAHLGEAWVFCGPAERISPICSQPKRTCRSRLRDTKRYVPDHSSTCRNHPKNKIRSSTLTP